ncbi:hypothetical protein GCM10007916_24420 [Psychromonas marina]|uniref:STAS/SEC14 domain-containing protein n=1 Tax=Psychromonas marina TaxID=88364 RepID=A0ABQ6E2E1_9GAMM|nr:hypothetical protein [Psychromonas marina]GLS91373.1 hypothetical protein GCM10007916_24420 [Psychromonas marina]
MREHGRFDMQVEEQVIVLKVYGAWNFETTSRWCHEYKDHIDAIKDKPWARLMDLTLWELTTPDVWELVDQVNQWANANNQQYDVVICPLSIQKQLLARAHQVLTNVEIVFCDNLIEARNWLKDNGL